MNNYIIFILLLLKEALPLSQDFKIFLEFMGLGSESG